MKTILCTNKTPIVVDDADYEFLSGFSWYAQLYPRTCIKGKFVRMHRLLLGEVAQGMFVDHVNGNKFDSRRENLRIVTPEANSMNRKKPCGGTSKYKGVFKRSSQKKWCARIGTKTKKIHLGYFTTETEAAQAYDRAARQHFGPYARLNFPDLFEQAA